MMAKKILSVGVEIPGEAIEEVNITSDRSLLDADIVIFKPAIPHRYYDDNYQGKPCLTDDASFRSRQALHHWRRELAAAFDAGKLIIILLASPDTVFAATGKVEHSGTGRNARTTRYVDELSSYLAVPVNWSFHPVSGREMRVKPKARFFLSYWNEFGDRSRYETYLEGENLKNILVTTKSGNRIVAAYLRKGRGALVALPNLDLDDDNFVEEKEADGDTDFYWTDPAIAFGKKLVGSLVAMADALGSEVTATPPPDWAREDVYRLPEEQEIEHSISGIAEQLASLEGQWRDLVSKLHAAGTLRNLLFEQGKPLENAVIQALELMGFDAKGLKEDDSEFDAVFTSPEGRFIGEVEGKDNRSINIENFSQLERNLNEDFARDEVDEHAKGVLFGNAFRLHQPDTRGDPFTQKCRSAAARIGAALVATPDLFAPCRYLKATSDADYARQCREAMRKTSGDVVAFPAPPIAETVAMTAVEVSSDNDEANSI